MEANEPENDSEFSREGTFAHSLGADLLADPEEPSAHTMLGETDGEFTVDAAFASAIDVYLDVVRNLVFIEDGVDRRPDLYIEHKVTIASDCWGTADAIVLSGDRRRLHLVDLKFGKGKLVVAENNEQLLVYAYGCMLSLPWLADVETITLHIVQPRVAGLDNNGHSQWSISCADLMAWAKETLLPGAQATRAKDAPLVAGPHCHFCKATVKCPKLKQEALEVAQAVFPTGDVAKPVTPPAPSALSGGDIAQVLKARKLFDTWADAVEKEAELRLRRGETVPGFKIVQSLGHRKWKDEKAAVAALKAAGINPIEASVVSPAEAERRLGAKRKGAVDPLTERPVSGEKVVPESDKRPALLTASDVFS